MYQIQKIFTCRCSNGNLHRSDHIGQRATLPRLALLLHVLPQCDPEHEHVQTLDGEVFARQQEYLLEADLVKVEALYV